MEKTENEKFEDFVREFELKIESRFVPFSFSRSSEEKEKNLNWKIKVSSKFGKIIFDFSKGIGHLPRFSHYSVLSGVEKSKYMVIANAAAESGEIHKIKIINGKINETYLKDSFPTPNLKEALGALCLDLEVLRYNSFEEWAKEFGYNEDSRKGEKVYNECCEMSSKFLVVLGGSNNVEKLGDLLRAVEEEDCAQVKEKNRPKF